MLAIACSDRSDKALHLSQVAFDLHPRPR